MIRIIRFGGSVEMSAECTASIATLPPWAVSMNMCFEQIVQLLEIEKITRGKGARIDRSRSRDGWLDRALRRYLNAQCSFGCA